MQNTLTKPSSFIEIDNQAGEIQISQQKRLWQRLEDAIALNSRSLDLSNTDLTKISAPELQKLAAIINSEITELDLSDTKFSADGSTSLNQSVNASTGKQNVYQFILGIVRNSKVLTSLSLAYNDLGVKVDKDLSNFLAELFKSLPFSSIKHLNLGHNDLVALPDLVWRTLLENISHLHSLNLSDNNIMVLDEERKAIFRQTVAKFFPGEKQIGLQQAQWELLLKVLRESDVTINLSHNHLITEHEIRQLNEIVAAKDGAIKTVRKQLR